MVLNVTYAVVAPIIVLAIAAALFRVYTAPERIQKRLTTAKEVCDQTGGRWVVNADRVAMCERS